jgi:chemotaxis methyl-accepting protein methylase
MKTIAHLLHRFDMWFTRNFWFYFTNGRKVEARRKLYKALDVNDAQVYQKAKPLMDNSEHFIC